MYGFKRGIVGDLFQWVVDNGNITEFESFVLICWGIWKARNISVFQGKSQKSNEVVFKANQTGILFKSAVDSTRSQGMIQNTNIQWQRPDPGVIKINVDAYVFSNSDYVGVDLGARDSSGIILYAEGQMFQGVSSHIGLN